MPNPIETLRDAGQSIWLDYIRRGLLTSGELERMVRNGWISGVTSNPTIFRKAISGSCDYEDDLRRLSVQGGMEPYDAYVDLGGQDVRLAADALRPTFDATAGGDGFVSFEVRTGDTEEMVREARLLWAVVGRPNLMIKIPGVQAGVAAVETLIAEGVNINVTLLFDVDVYEQFALAYLAGLERRLAAGLPVDNVASVASFFVSRVDTKVDALLAKDSPLLGRVAVANGRAAYARFQRLFSGPRWEALSKAGARLQRPLWASTGTKNQAYSDVLYVEDLVGPHTVNTLPEATLLAFLDHGRVRPALLDGQEEAERVLGAAADAGIDLKQVASQLLEEGLAAFESDFEALLGELRSALDRLPIVKGEPSLGSLSEKVERRLGVLAENEVVRRVWEADHTVWSHDPTEITKPNRLGWLNVIDPMLEEAPALKRFAQEVAGEGFTTAVLLGMGGSSLAAEVLYSAFGPAPGGLSLRVLDTTVPAEILALERELDLSKTLFIVASKSGTTLETLSHLDYFWNKVPRGESFIAITDRGTPLERIARERSFRRAFLNLESIGGRYSALTYFGLVPAALVGVDIEQLVDFGHEMQHACHYCVPPAGNPGAWLGAVIGEAALAGRDKLTLVLPDEFAALGAWLEQLLAESTGKLGKGIIPVAGEALGDPRVYGDDRLFVAFGDRSGLAALEAAGQPIVRIALASPYQLGAEFFRWEFATAIAGHVIGINPFDQPNVQQAKDATDAVLRGEGGETKGPGAAEVLAQVKTGDYIAIQAYLPRTGEVRTDLARLRLKLRDRHRVATTVGFGPRYLHSTGQIHKGGANSGVFLQIVSDIGEDIQVPGRRFSFGRLMQAQADGDLLALRSSNRRVARITMAELDEVLR